MCHQVLFSVKFTFSNISLTLILSVLMYTKETQKQIMKLIVPVFQRGGYKGVEHTTQYSQDGDPATRK